MSAVLLSNWFPIRAYDSDNDPRLPGRILVYSPTQPRLALLELCGWFLPFFSFRLGLISLSRGEPQR